MPALRFAGITLQVVALAVLMVVCLSVATWLSGFGQIASQPLPGAATPPPMPQPQEILPPLLVMAFSVSAVVAYLAMRSRWAGARLAAALFLAIYGVMTVISQVESAIYLPDKLPAGFLPRAFLMGAIFAALYAPAAVVVVGRLRSQPEAAANPRLMMSAGVWAWKLALIAIVYLALYEVFGYYVAWKNPAVQAYYGGTDAGGFWLQMLFIWETTPWMFPFQMARGLLWALLVLPLIRMLKGPAWETGVAMGLFFSVWSTMLLLPNPLMPEAVARTHLVETFWSNLIFGFLVGWLMSGGREAAEPRQAAHVAA